MRQIRTEAPESNLGTGAKTRMLHMYSAFEARTFFIIMENFFFQDGYNRGFCTTLLWYHTGGLGCESAKKEGYCSGAKPLWAVGGHTTDLLVSAYVAEGDNEGDRSRKVK